MYSLYVTPDETKLTAKGIKKYFVEKNLKHENYVKTLQNGVGTVAQFNAIQSRNHVLKTVTLKKSCLSAFDDKRYLLKDGIHSLAYGHYKIASDEAVHM
jgi:ketopantoate reductase